MYEGGRREEEEEEGDNTEATDLARMHTEIGRGRGRGRKREEEEAEWREEWSEGGREGL